MKTCKVMMNESVAGHLVDHRDIPADGQVVVSRSHDGTPVYAAAVTYGQTRNPQTGEWETTDRIVIDRRPQMRREFYYNPGQTYSLPLDEAERLIACGAACPVN